MNKWKSRILRAAETAAIRAGKRGEKERRQQELFDQLEAAFRSGSGAKLARARENLREFYKAVLG
jgi:hypothetical protein